MTCANFRAVNFGKILNISVSNEIVSFILLSGTMIVNSDEFHINPNHSKNCTGSKIDFSSLIKNPASIKEFFTNNELFLHYKVQYQFHVLSSI